MSDVDEEIRKTRDRLAALEKIKDEKAGDNSDSDLDIIEVLEAEPNYYGIPRVWRPLQEHLARVVQAKHPSIGTGKDAAYKQAADYVNCWKAIGFSYERLKEETKENDLRISQRKVAKDIFPRKLWTMLNDNREYLANNVSLSFAIDKSLDHFRVVLSNEEHETRIKLPPIDVDVDGDDTDSDIIVETIVPRRDEATIGEEPVIKTHTRSSSCVPLVNIPLEDKEFLENVALQLQLKGMQDDRIEEIAVKMRDLLLESGLSVFDLLQLFVMDRLWYPENQENIRQILIHHLDKVTTSNVVAELQDNSLDMKSICLEFCQAFCNKFPLYSEIIHKNPTSSGKYADAVKLSSSEVEIMESSLETLETRCTSSPSRSLHSHLGGNPPARSLKSQESNSWTFNADACGLVFPAEENNLHRLPGHPFKRVQPLVGDIDDYLMVSVEMVTCGEGLQNTEILQICLKSNESKTFFAPVLPSNVNIHTEDLETFGFIYEGEKSKLSAQDSQQEMYYQNPINNKKMKTLNQYDALLGMVEFLRKALSKTDLDGIILVTLHRETLMSLLTCINHAGKTVIDQFLRIVKGFNLVEPIVKRTCLTHNNGDVRLSHQNVEDIFKTDSTTGNDLEKRCSVSFEVNRKLNAHNLLQETCNRIDSSLLTTFENYVEELSKFSQLPQYLSSKLIKCEDPPLTGLLCAFPKKRHILVTEDHIAHRFVELLVLNNHDVSSLNQKLQRKGKEQLKKNLEEMLSKNATQCQSLCSLNILELAVNAIVEWMWVGNATSSENMFSSEKVEGTPIYDSEGSMPEELPSVKKPLKNPEMVNLRDFLMQRLGSANLRKFTKNILESITHSMCCLWENCDFSIEQLRSLFCDHTLSFEKKEDICLKALSKKIRSRPSEWKGFGLGDMIEATSEYFVNVAPYNDMKFTVLEDYFAERIQMLDIKIGNAQIARNVTNAIESIGYSYKSIMAKIEMFDLSTTNSKEFICLQLKKQFPTPPCQWSGLSHDFIANELVNFFKTEKEKKIEIPKSERKRRNNEVDINEPKPKMNKLNKMEREWADLYKGSEPFKELECLLIYCDKIKEDSYDWQFVGSKQIILDLERLLKKSDLDLRTVRNKLTGKEEYEMDLELHKMLTSVFGNSTSKKGNTKSYVASSDFEFYRNLFERFCYFIQNPLSMNEESDNIVTLEVEPEEPEYVESIETIEIIVEELQKRYSMKIQDLPTFQQLQEHLFYHPSVIGLNSTHSKANIVNDLVEHISMCGNMNNLMAKVLMIKEQSDKKECHQLLNHLFKVSSFPNTCVERSGLLLNVVMEFFDHAFNIVPISKEVCKIDMILDETNSLHDLQRYLFHCYIEEAIQMSRKGELLDFSLEAIDIPSLSLSVHSTVNFLLTIGFNLYEAIKLFIEGSLIKALNKLIKSHEGKTVEASNSMLLTRIVNNFIETKIKMFRQETLPLSKSHRNLLKLKVIHLLNNGHFLKKDHGGKVTVNKTLPRQHQETLHSISKIDYEDVCEDMHEAKIEIDPLLQNVPGTVVLEKALVIPPMSNKTFYASVLGIPTLENGSILKLSYHGTQKEKCEYFIPKQETVLEQDQTIKITLQNRNEETELNLQKGHVIALVTIPDVLSILDKTKTPGFCLQFIKYYHLQFHLEDIVDKGDQIIFGKDFSLPFLKNQKTNFKIWGTEYSMGHLDYYTVDAVVYFLHQVKHVIDSYEDYLHLALTFNKQIIRYKDFKDLYQFLYGESESCEQIDRNYTKERDEELSKRTSLKQFVEINKKGKMENGKDIKDHPKENHSSSSEYNSVKTVNDKLLEFLVSDCGMSLTQSTEELKSFHSHLADLGYPMEKLMVDFLSLPGHGEVFKNILKGMLREKLKVPATVGAKDVGKFLDLTTKRIQNMFRPTSVKEICVFIELVKLFEKEIPEIEDKDAMQKLSSKIGSKKPYETYNWDDEGLRIFNSLVGSLSSMKCFKPPTENGAMELFSASSDLLITNILVQEHEERLFPIAYSTRMLTPREQMLKKIERDALAVVWAVEVNRQIIFRSNIKIKVSSQQLHSIFDPSNSESSNWARQINDVQYSVEEIKELKNPALALTLPAVDDYPKAFDQFGLMEALFEQSLIFIKESAKDRTRWLKSRKMKERRQIFENVSKSLPSFDISNDGFIVASSVANTVQDITDTNLPSPSCAISSFQPLFKVFFNKLMSCRYAEWDTAEQESNKVFENLMLNGITYSRLKNFISKLCQDQGSSKIVERALDKYLSDCGVDDLYERDFFLSCTVKHFENILKIKPTIAVNLKSKVVNVNRAYQDLFEVEEVEDPFAENSCEENTDGPNPSWYLELSDSEGEHVKDNENSDWSQMEVPETMLDGRQRNSDLEAEDSENDFAPLKKYYDKMIKCLPTHLKLNYEANKIRGSQLCECWVMSKLDFRHLKETYRLNIRAGRNCVMGKYQHALDAYKVLFNRGIDVPMLITWTFGFFKTTSKNIHTLYTFHQRNTLIKAQRGENTKGQFRELQNFFVNILTKTHKETKTNSYKIAKDYVKSIEMVGFSKDTVERLFTAAVTSTECLARFNNDMMSMFDNVSVLLPKTVDIKRLLKYTIVFYRSKYHLREVLSISSELHRNSIIEAFNPMLMHCSTALISYFDRNNPKSVGHVVTKGPVIVQPGENAEVKGKISWIDSEPPEIGTPLQINTHEILKDYQGNLEVETRIFNYAGVDIEVVVNNKAKHAAASLGNPGRLFYIANVEKVSPTPDKIEEFCQKMGGMLVDKGLDIHLLGSLCRDFVLQTKGCSRSVLRIALEYSLNMIASEDESLREQHHVLEQFTHHALLYCSKLKLSEGTDKIDKVDIQEVDIEDGECLSDDDDEEPDIKIKEIKYDSDNEEEVDIEDILSFKDPHTAMKQEESIDTKEVDIFKLIKRYVNKIDITAAEENKVDIGQFLVDLKKTITIDEVDCQYNIESLVMFAKHCDQSHSVYVKKVSNQFPGISLVHMNHRVGLSKAFSDDKTSTHLVAMPTKSRKDMMERATSQFHDLCAGHKSLPESLPQTMSKDYQPLFDKYFTSIYMSGLGCQLNWTEVARVAAEELINCWLSAGFHFAKLLSHMSELGSQQGPDTVHGRRMKEKHEKIFRYFYGEFCKNMDKMPPSLNVKVFVKNSIQYLKQIDALQKLWQEEKMEISLVDDEDTDSDIEVIEIVETVSEKEGGEESRSLHNKGFETNTSNKIPEDLADLNIQQLEAKIKELQEMCEIEEDSSPSFNLDKLQQLSSFVSQCQSPADHQLTDNDDVVASTSGEPKEDMADPIKSNRLEDAIESDLDEGKDSDHQLIDNDDVVGSTSGAPKEDMDDHIKSNRLEDEIESDSDEGKYSEGDAE